ncbi:MAG: PAS domain-containing protein [Verrucomicrobiae bacterium]|nr:PAS domain-containing protein [Verrucomicrobiae bacterium]
MPTVKSPQKAKNRDSKCIFEGMLRDTEYGIVITDRKGRIEWVNPGFTELCGYTLPEIRGKRPGAFLQGPETCQKTVAKLHEAVVHSLPCDVRIVNYHKNGKKYVAEINIFPIRDARGKLVRFGALEKKISGRKKPGKSGCSKMIVNLYAALFEIKGKAGRARG